MDNKYHAIDKILENGAPYFSSWAGTFQIELQLLCSTFKASRYYSIHREKGIWKNIL